MLSGRPAFYRSGDEFFQTCYRILHAEPDPLPDPAMHAAIMRALCKEPGERYPGLSEFVAAVQECVPQALYLPFLPAQTARLPAGRRPTRSPVSAIAPLSIAGQSLSAAAGQAASSGSAEMPAVAGGAAAVPLGRRRLAYRWLSSVAISAALAVAAGLFWGSRARGKAPMPPARESRPPISVQSDPLPVSALPPPMPLPQNTSPASTPAAPAPVLSTPDVAQERPAASWKLYVLDGVPAESRLAARLRSCLRGSGLLDCRYSSWQKTGQGRFRLLNQSEILTLDPALKVPGSIRHQANSCLATISQDMAMVPDQISLMVRRD